jgi:hypothetical protein
MAFGGDGIGILDEGLCGPITSLGERCATLLRLLDQDEALEAGAYGSDDERGYVEAALHEIAHVVVLRRGIRAALRRPPVNQSVGEIVPQFPGWRTLADEPLVRRVTGIANEHEIETIAVEVIAAARAGTPLMAHDIAVFAVDGENVRDLGNADAVTKLIHAAMKEPRVRRWGRGLGDYLTRGA